LLVGEGHTLGVRAHHQIFEQRFGFGQQLDRARLLNIDLVGVRRGHRVPHGSELLVMQISLQERIGPAGRANVSYVELRRVSGSFDAGAASRASWTLPVRFTRRTDEINDIWRRR
jgi:hypothetical protein